MEIESIEKANEILKKIKAQEKAIKLIESGGTIKVEQTQESNIAMSLFIYDCPVEFEDWERRLIVHNKKQWIQALEKKLEVI